MADGETSRRARRSYPDLSPRDPSRSALHAITGSDEGRKALEKKKRARKEKHAEPAEGH